MDALGFFLTQTSFKEIQGLVLTLNPFESSSPKMLDHLEARNEDDLPPKITSSCTTLAFSSHSLLKNVFGIMVIQRPNMP